MRTGLPKNHQTSKRGQLLKAAFFIPFLLIITCGVMAQVTTSSISGSVTGQNKQTIQSASIVLVHEPTGTKYGVATTADGRYRIGNLAPGGPYKMTISYVGFEKDEHTDIYLNLGIDQQLDIALKPAGSALTEVTVVAGRRAPQNGAGTRISREQIRTLPSQSRSIPDMTRLTPQNTNNSFAGTNFRYNNVTIDGAINNDAIGFSPSLGGQSGTSGMPGSSTRTNPVSIDAIQDIQVYLAPFDVKIGNFLGGSVNAVTRSGTNKVEGSVYGYGRNASLVGPNNAGDKAKLPKQFHDYQTGFRVGLPIIKDKLFFFTNEEITRRQDPVILAAGSRDIANVIDLASAQKISNYLNSTYGINAGTYGNTSIYSNSTKFFNRIDWNINDKNQLSIRNNTITSQATNLERDQQNFRFGSIDYKQINNQTSTVAELKTRFTNTSNNSLVVGYSSVHDYREPTSDPRLPQVQIAGLAPGTTIFLGTDREASIFNMKQKTLEITDNYTFTKGKNTFTIGTHNEFYRIQYGFVNSWNGRVDYASVDSFLLNKPSRVRGNYNYANNTRSYIMDNPPAAFNVNMYSVYAQDEIRFSNKFKLSPGIRFDLASVPGKQALSSKTTNSPVDPNYGRTYAHTQARDIRNEFLGNVMFSPRLGFNYDIKGNRSVILRGGTGVFTGRIPFAWLGYSFYNNGETYGAFDKRSSAGGFVAGSSPLALSNNGIANFASQNGAAVNDKTKSTQVDLIDNKFKMPAVWRSDLALDYTLPANYKLTLEGIYTKVIRDLKFQQINIVDNPVYYPYDVNHQQPIYPSGAVNPLYTNAYLLSNTNQGYRYSLTAQLSKSYSFGLDFMAAYTYGQSKDITNGIRNSMESNWQLNQALNPNEPGLANSNFDVRHRIVGVVNEKINWGGRGKLLSTFTLFVNAQSGYAYTWGFSNATIQNTPQQVSLAYIPKVGETIGFFANRADDGTAAQQAARFDAYIDANKYLSERRGQFTERNGGRTPWNTTADFRFTQDFVIASGARKHTITFTYDIFNLTNLISSSWGRSYFSPNTFNSTASVGLALQRAGTATTNPVYRFITPQNPYSVDFFSSRYQMQFGLRYSF